MKAEKRRVFMCSLCHKGILGGGLYLDSQAVVYRTNKLTVSEKYRHLVLALNDIRELTWKWFVFPIATFHMQNGEKYKMIIFNKARFQRVFQERMAADMRGEVDR